MKTEPCNHVIGTFYQDHQIHLVEVDHPETNLQEAFRFCPRCGMSRAEVDGDMNERLMDSVFGKNTQTRNAVGRQQTIL